MKIPQHMTMKPSHLGVVKDAAKALEIEAHHHRKAGNKEAAWALREAAKTLKRLGDDKAGLTWAEAFDWQS